MSQENFLFAPTKEQIQNAHKSRESAPRDLNTFPYFELQNAQSLDPSVSVISLDESQVLPHTPKLRETFFSSLSTQMKRIVLRANIAGLNLTATGSNKETFLYLAPESELERTKMITQLHQIEQQIDKRAQKKSPLQSTRVQDNELELSLPEIPLNMSRE